MTPGARLAQFIKKTNDHCYMQNIEALGFVISEKMIILVLSVSHCKSMETVSHRGVAKFDPRGIAGTINAEDH